MDERRTRRTLALPDVVGWLFAHALRVVPLNPFRWLRERFSSTPIRLAIVRKYQDANGAYIGELYLHETVKRQHDTLEGYVMIGASLDTLPYDAQDGGRFMLDTRNDFLAPMMPNVLRVGSLMPEDNEAVKRRVSRMPRRRIRLTLQNRFIEAVQEKR